MDLPPIVANAPIAPRTNIVWPKRTSKACSNCRRDKVRCDGEKPCLSCRRRSIACTEGCDPCRKARARCEKSPLDTEDRCVRCVSRELECTTDDTDPVATTASLPSVEPNLAPPVVDVVSERTKAACQSCCQSNKKCDNQRPCSRCVSRSEECLPASPRIPKQARLRCEGCKKQSIRCDDARPCQNCVTAGMECVNVTKVRGCGTRVKAACLACRRSKTRCDGDRPCLPCKKRKSECIGQLCKRCVHDGKTTCNHTGYQSDASPSSSSVATTLRAPNQQGYYPSSFPWPAAITSLPGHPPPMHSLQQPVSPTAGPSNIRHASDPPPPSPPSSSSRHD